MWIHPLRISLLVYALTPGGSARDPQGIFSSGINKGDPQEILRGILRGFSYSVTPALGVSLVCVGRRMHMMKPLLLLLLLLRRGKIMSITEAKCSST